MSETADKPVVALLVDDDDAFRDRLGRALSGRDWEVFGAADATQTLEQIREVSPDLVLLDLRMPEVGGLDLIEQIKSIDATITVVILTGYGSIATALEALKSGADHYLSKPVDAEQIIATYEELRAAPRRSHVPTTVPTLARVEWEHIQRVLSDCGGNVTRAAKLLGIHRRSLQRKLAKYPPNR